MNNRDKVEIIERLIKRLSNELIQLREKIQRCELILEHLKR